MFDLNLAGCLFVLTENCIKGSLKNFPFLWINVYYVVTLESKLYIFQTVKLRRIASV